MPSCLASSNVNVCINVSIRTDTGATIGIHYNLCINNRISTAECTWSWRLLNECVQWSKTFRSMFVMSLIVDIWHFILFFSLNFFSFHFIVPRKIKFCKHEVLPHKKLYRKFTYRSIRIHIQVFILLYIFIFLSYICIHLIFNNSILNSIIYVLWDYTWS